MPLISEINQHIAYFGYGSLVNRATHQADIVDFTRARLKGFRRQWLARPKSKFGHVALLSVVGDANYEIDGLVVLDYHRNLQMLDRREIRYDRTKIDRQQLSISGRDGGGFGSPQAPLFIYEAKTLPQFEDGEKCRILRSYLDAVMQGYHNKFGREGLREFIATTTNFEIGIREDRHAPIYSRPVAISHSEQSLFDELAPPSG